MKYYFDTEFIEDGKTIDLISIGIVAADDRELYLANSNCDLSKSSQWVRDNVLIPMDIDFSIPSLPMRPIAPEFWIPRSNIAQQVIEFCNPEVYGKPEFWAYYADYDHIVLCQLFGTMDKLPVGFPMYTKDLKQTIDELGNPPIKEQSDSLHNALSDARWIRDTYLYLKENYKHPAFDDEIY